MRKAAKSSGSTTAGNGPRPGSGPNKQHAPRAKKYVREPEWTAVPTKLNRSQVEDRFYVSKTSMTFELFS